MLHGHNFFSPFSIFCHFPMLNFLEGWQMEKHPKVKATTTTTTMTI